MRESMSRESISYYCKRYVTCGDYSFFNCSASLNDYRRTKILKLFLLSRDIEYPIFNTLFTSQHIYQTRSAD